MNDVTVYPPRFYKVCCHGRGWHPTDDAHTRMTIQRMASKGRHQPEESAIRWSIIRGQYSMRRKPLQAMPRATAGAPPAMLHAAHPQGGNTRSPPSPGSASGTGESPGTSQGQQENASARGWDLQKVLTIGGPHGIVSFCVRRSDWRAQNYLTYTTQHAIMGYNRPESYGPEAQAFCASVRGPDRHWYGVRAGRANRPWSWGPSPRPPMAWPRRFLLTDHGGRMAAYSIQVVHWCDGNKDQRQR